MMQAPPDYGSRSPDGAWWWDGHRWIPVIAPPAAKKRQPRRALSGSSFLFAALAFILPLFSVSCAGQKVISVSGVQAATGYEVAQSGLANSTFGNANAPPTSEPGDWRVQAAAAAAVIGALAAVARDPFLRAVRVLAGTVLIGSLAWLWIDIGQQVAQSGGGLLAANPEIGFWLILAGGVVGLVATLAEQTTAI